MRYFLARQWQSCGTTERRSKWCANRKHLNDETELINRILVPEHQRGGEEDEDGRVELLRFLTYTTPIPCMSTQDSTMPIRCCGTHGLQREATSLSRGTSRVSSRDLRLEHMCRHAAGKVKYRCMQNVDTSDPPANNLTTSNNLSPPSTPRYLVHSACCNPKSYRLCLSPGSPRS